MMVCVLADRLYSSKLKQEGTKSWLEIKWLLTAPKVSDKEITQSELVAALSNSPAFVVRQDEASANWVSLQLTNRMQVALF